MQWADALQTAVRPQRCQVAPVVSRLPMTAGAAWDTTDLCATADVWQAVVDGTMLSHT